MNQTNASAITPNRWEELKQWVQDTAQNEANHASIDQAGNQYAVSESRGRISALRSVLAHMELMELKAI